MLKLLAVFCVIASCGAMSVDSLTESICGGYKLIYRWPKTDRHVPNCSDAVFSKADPDVEASVSCKCGRPINEVVLHIEAPGRKFNFLSEVVDNADDLRAALDDKCDCVPSGKVRDVIYKVSDDYILQYIPWMPSVFLHGRKVPSRQELDDLFSQLPDLKDKEGSLLCV